MIAVCYGTRPEIIKMSPVIKELIKRGLPFYTIHSGQHYSPAMSGNLFDELQIPQPTYNLEVGSAPPFVQVSEIILRAGTMLTNKADLVLVHGDTNTTLGCALAAKKIGIPIGHVEAGLRCGDRSMPEEINRILTDEMSDLWFPPTKGALDMLSFGFFTSLVTGNTIIDALQQNLLEIGEPDTQYILLTLHRQENVDDPRRLVEILHAVGRLAKKTNLPVLFPCHPRTEKNIKNLPDEITVFPPVGFKEFLKLEAEASMILTDSGGVVEEACYLKVPCVILRTSTERPEAIAVGAARLVTSPKDLVFTASQFLESQRDWKNPFGDGHAAEKIVDGIEEWTK